MLKRKIILLLGLTLVIILICAGCAEKEDDNKYDGWIYAGDLKDGKPNGIGVGTKEINRNFTIIYTGEWADGKQHGSGKEIIKAFSAGMSAEKITPLSDGKQRVEVVTITNNKGEVILTADEMIFEDGVYKDNKTTLVYEENDGKYLVIERTGIWENGEFIEASE